MSAAPYYSEIAIKLRNELIRDFARLDPDAPECFGTLPQGGNSADAKGCNDPCPFYNQCGKATKIVNYAHMALERFESPLQIDDGKIELTNPKTIHQMELLLTLHGKYKKEYDERKQYQDLLEKAPDLIRALLTENALLRMKVEYK